MVKNNDPFIIPYELKKSKAEKITEPLSLEITDSFLIDKSGSLWLGGIISKIKSQFFFIFIILLFAALFGRLFYLQVIRGDYYLSLTEGNRLRLESQVASRGIFFDLYEKPLVENQPSFSLIAYSQEVRAEDKEKILTILNFTAAEQLSQLNIVFNEVGYFPVVIAENLSYEEAISLIIKLKNFSGFKVEIDSQRHYLMENALAHLLGYTSRITPAEKDEFLAKGYLLTEKVGRSGLEESYQTILRGELGKRRVEVDNLGRVQKIVAQEEPLAGDNIFLNLDSGLQEKIVEVLKSRVLTQSGAVVALDPTNGQVRALVSWPLFNHNAFSQGMTSADYQKIVTNPLNPLFNRVISGEYPPGSTVKLIIGAAALKEGLITRATQLLSLGGVWYDKWFFPDWKSGGHGYTNIIKAIAESVNTYFYYLALESFEGHQGLGLEKILSYLQLFGLGNLTGINLSGEATGFLPTREWKQRVKGEIWYPGDTLHLVIGQGDILVTPLQVASYTAVVANGGTLYKPELVKKIVKTTTGEVEQLPAQIITERVVKKEYLEIIKEGMRAAVTSGSARGIANLSIPLAAKTGTAEVGGNRRPHSWFTSFGPVNDAKLVLTVLIENGGEGSETALPIARDLWQWYAENRL